MDNNVTNAIDTILDDLAFLGSLHDRDLSSLSGEERLILTVINSPFEFDEEEEVFQEALNLLGVEDYRNDVIID